MYTWNGAPNLPLRMLYFACKLLIELNQHTYRKANVDMADYMLHCCMHMQSIKLFTVLI